MADSTFLDAALETLVPPTQQGASEPVVFTGDLKRLPSLLASAEKTSLVDGVMQLVTFAMFLKSKRQSPKAADAFLRALAAAAREPLAKIGQQALAQKLAEGFDSSGTSGVANTEIPQMPGSFQTLQGASLRRTHERALKLLKERLAQTPTPGGLDQLDVDSLSISDSNPGHIHFAMRDGSVGLESSPIAQALRVLIGDRFELSSAVIGRPA